jgi:DNA replication protein DnaC
MICFKNRLLPVTTKRRLSMLIELLLQLLNKLKLLGMLAALERRLGDPDIASLRFEDRLGMLLQHELADREKARFSQRLRIANQPQAACLEDLDTHIPTRHLDPAMISTVRDLGWIDRHLNVLITGPTGIGKSCIGAALAHAACRMNYHVRCFRASSMSSRVLTPSSVAPRSCVHSPKQTCF